MDLEDFDGFGWIWMDLEDFDGFGSPPRLSRGATAEVEKEVDEKGAGEMAEVARVEAETAVAVIGTGEMVAVVLEPAREAAKVAEMGAVERGAAARAGGELAEAV